MILNIFKIGSSIVDNDVWLSSFSSQLAAVEGKNLIVHGGGKVASEICEKMGIEVQMHHGRRITDSDTLKVMVMTYAGQVNKMVVARLQAAGINAVGLTGVDGNTIEAHKRHPGEIDPDIDYGFAGDIDAIHPEFILTILHNGFVPVVAPLSHDGNGQILNTNADTIAARLSGALASSFTVRLIFLMDHPGVLMDINDEDSVISQIQLDDIKPLKDKGIISEGMIPKLYNAKQALESGVDEVLLTNIESINTLSEGTGTRIIQIPASRT